jgi:flagellar hook assembly protein FlgD
VPDEDEAVTRIERVYPNPFNPTTTIEYSLARRTHVEIRVIDVAGRVVATLLDGPAGPGAARVTWDGTTDDGHHAASGVYFVNLVADGLADSRKAVLLK